MPSDMKGALKRVAFAAVLFVENSVRFAKGKPVPKHILNCLSAWKIWVVPQCAVANQDQPFISRHA